MTFSIGSRLVEPIKPGRSREERAAQSRIRLGGPPDIYEARSGRTTKNPGLRRSFLATPTRLEGAFETGRGTTKPRARERAPFTRRGATLIEVLGGLVLLGGVLGALLVAEGRSARQAALAQRRLQGVAAANALLSEWWRDPRALPASDRGTVDADATLVWRTTTVDDPVAADLRGRVLRLEIFDARGADPSAPITSIDVVVPRPPAAASSRTEK